jgi:hypothetical protein
MAGSRAITGKYVGKASAELTALRTQLESARTACLTGHQSYSRPGFSFNRVSFDSICQELAEVEYAQGLAAGTIATTTYADVSA